MGAKKGTNTVSVVTDLVKPITQELNLILWDVVFEKEGTSWFLRIYIDSENGVSIDDCENVSRRLDTILDEVDPIQQSYYLEVSSAGLGRKLKKPSHFKAMIGQEVSVKLIRAIDNIREFIGILKSFEDDEITIMSEEIEHKFNFRDCSYVKLNDDENLFD